MIEFSGVHKRYDGGVLALNGIDLKIDKGEFVFLVGPSGSGKSTLLKLMIREEIADSGTILLNNYKVHCMKDRYVPFLRRSVGIVFQDFRLLPDKTVYENVAFAMRIVRKPARLIRRQVPMLLSLVGLSSKSNNYPHELSGGEQQRVAMARALANNPSVLIADEPTGNLDPENAWEIMRVLNEINLRGTTVVVATHAKDIVDAMKKRVVELEKGKILRDQRHGAY
ncbi:MAG: cell division ATP-binding protein FtsE [Clostridia bacterium]|nr:cell division ATP-binding protein FtsE [Clostridia bacterium]